MTYKELKIKDNQIYDFINAEKKRQLETLEMIASANFSFSLAPGLSAGAISAITFHGNDEQKAMFLPKLVTGEWTGTMNLSEPQAGSDLGPINTKAIKQEDGTYRINGTKVWITFGEHDMTENIIHLVLARTPDAPEGTKGISMFIVPKYLVNAEGDIGQKNEVRCNSIEEKLGIHASPTCVMEYGGDKGAVGYLMKLEFGLEDKDFQQQLRLCKEQHNMLVIESKEDL